MEADLAALGERVSAHLNPLAIVRRHPLLTVIAGGFLGAVLLRRPGWLARSAGRTLAWGAPILLSSLARRTPR